MTNKMTTNKNAVKLYTDSLAYAVKLTEKYSKMLGLQLFAKLNAEISPEELLVLGIASDNTDICQRDLAKLLIKDRANTGRLLESLEKKKLIERVVDVKNNRLVKKTYITPQGQNVLDNLMDKVIPVFDKVYENFTEEEIQLTKNVLKKMRDTFQEIVDIQI